MKKFKLKDLVYIAMFTALTAVCSWIFIPIGDVPVTLQTFAVFCAAGMLGMKRSFISVAVYILLGAAGVPVFSGFKGGFGALAGPTGGYIVGFLFTVIVASLIIKAFKRKMFPVCCLAFAAGLIVCYAFGTAWFYVVYTKNTGEIGLATVLLKCVVPFLIPDAVKIAAASAVVPLVSRALEKSERQ